MSLDRLDNLKMIDAMKEHGFPRAYYFEEAISSNAWGDLTTDMDEVVVFVTALPFVMSINRDSIARNAYTVWVDKSMKPQDVYNGIRSALKSRFDRQISRKATLLIRETYSESAIPEVLEELGLEDIDGEFFVKE